MPSISMESWKFVAGKFTTGKQKGLPAYGNMVLLSSITGQASIPVDLVSMLSDMRTHAAQLGQCCFHCNNHRLCI